MNYLFQKMINEDKRLLGQQEYLQMHYLHTGTRYLNCFSRLGRNRESGGKSAELYTGVIRSTADCCDQSALKHSYRQRLCGKRLTCISHCWSHWRKRWSPLKWHQSTLWSPRISNCLHFSISPTFRATLSILFINLGCQVVLHVSHVSNLVLNHWKRQRWKLLTRTNCN